MAWMNLDINGYEIEDPDIVYCVVCDGSGLANCVPIDAFVEENQCANCGQPLWLNWTPYGASFQAYLLSGSQWDEGLPPVNGIKQYPPF